MKVHLINVSIGFFLLFLLVATYFVTITKSFLKLNEILKCINCLFRYLNSATVVKQYLGFQLDKKDNYQQCLNEALLKFPVIQKYTGYYSSSLVYGTSDVENFKVAADIYNILLMKRNYLIQDLKSSFNPIHTLKTLFAFPSNLIEWIGFNTSEVAARVINLIGWIASFIVGIYSSEIKDLITALIHKLTN